ncbi:MAG: hypothetical protein FWE95_08985, partial [Planctomycetaceae bacterium]|nr:hypothetical protein [Planctomycetaceae bacterium]
IAEFDVRRPIGTESLTRIYDFTDFPPGWFWIISQQIQTALEGRIQILPNIVPGQLTVVGKLADQERVAAIVEQMRDERLDASAVVETYFVNRTVTRAIVDAMILQIAPSAQRFSGTTENQIVVWAKPSDHERIDAAIAKLNTTDPDVSLQVYRTGAQRAYTAILLLQQRFPGILVTQSSSSELVAWGTSAEHKQIADLLGIVSEAFPDYVVKPYAFRHIPLAEAYTFLATAFTGLATIYQRPSNNDLIVYAPEDIHAKIDASIQGFDISNPETELLPRTYDLSDIPAAWFPTAAQQITIAFSGRLQVAPGTLPGQIVAWGRLADLDKLDMMVEQMLSERAVANAEFKVYTVERTNDVMNIMTLIRGIAPNAQLGYTANLNQISAYARESDHRKIKEIIDRMDESGIAKEFRQHSLKNINWLVADYALQYLRTRQGLDIDYQYDSFGFQFLVMADEEGQQAVANVLDQLRAEERHMLTIILQRTDPLTARSAVLTLFAEIPQSVRPFVDVDVNSNMLMVSGMEVELEQVRKLLRQMGENIPDPNAPLVPPPPAPNIRTIPYRGGETLQELQKIWQDEGVQNPLQVIPPTPTPSQFSVEEEVQRDQLQPYEVQPDENENGESTRDLSPITGLFPSAAPVYVVVNADGTLTITSSDTDALDRFETYLKRIESRVFYEGPNFTMFSVHNVSASIVAARLQQMLTLQASSRQPAGVMGAAAQIPFQIQPDLSTNTVLVRGSKMWRDEAEKLIEKLDEPNYGVRFTQKPVTVDIKNTTAALVNREVMNVYGAEMARIQLPGGNRPQIIVNATKNSLEIFAPESLATELKEYAEEIDRKALEDPVRKISIVELQMKGTVIKSLLDEIRWQQAGFGNMQMMPGMQPNMIMPNMMPMQQGMMMPMGGMGMMQPTMQIPGQPFMGGAQGVRPGMQQGGMMQPGMMQPGMQGGMRTF